MTKTFDLEKAMRNGGKCVTRDGRPARIICTDMIGTFKGKAIPLVVLVRGHESGDEERPFTYMKEGNYETFAISSNDLFNIPEKKKGWIAHSVGDSKSRMATDIYYKKEDLLEVLKGREWPIQEIEWTEE